MPGSYVVVRFPHGGTLFGEAVARYPGAEMTSVVAGGHEHSGRSFIDHVALVEGLPDPAIAELLLAWSHRYGEAPQVLGGPFALRLPIALDVNHTAAAAAILRLEQELPKVCHRFREGGVELWSPCGTPAIAERQCAHVRALLGAMPATSVGTGDPPQDALDCWDLLRTAAAGVVPDCLAAS